MREVAEFRVVEEFAPSLFADDEGRRLGGWIRQVRVATDDPRFQQIGTLHAELVRDRNRSFFHGWEIIRHYSKSELDMAKLLYLHISAMFEPAGEECGTLYDETVSCPLCGAGRRQISDLVLDLRKAPKRADIARTIADEWIISKRLAKLLEDEGATGFELKPVHHKGYHGNDPIDLRKYPSGRKLVQEAVAAGIVYPSGEFDVWLNQADRSAVLDRVWEEHAQAKERRLARLQRPLPVWYQLSIVSRPVKLSDTTRFGINPFNEDPEGEYRCPLGHVKGLNLLSEVMLKPDSWDGSDIVVTDGLVGMKRGLLRPRPLLLVSRRVRRLLEENGVTGYKMEIARLV